MLYIKSAMTSVMSLGYCNVERGLGLVQSPGPADFEILTNVGELYLSTLITSLLNAFLKSLRFQV